MSDQAQKAKIHIAKKELSLTDEEYRALLSGFGVSSSKDLSFSQAEELLKTFKELGWKPRPKTRTTAVTGSDKGWGKDKYEYLRPRPADMADPVQLRLAEVLWRIVARNPGDAALEKFIARQTKIRRLEWLKKHHIRAVLCGLQDMYAKGNVEQIRERESLLTSEQRDFLTSNIDEIIYMR